MSGPQVTIDLGRIEHNAKVIVERCAASGIKVFGVTKGTCGMPHVARAMLRGGVVGIAESRFENIHRLRESGISCPIMLLRSPPMARAEDVVRNVDISLQSELAVIREISRVAERLGRVHDIILMVDLGDLREGIWPSELLPTVEAVMQLDGVRIAGLGTNLTCFGAIIPTEENLGQLIAHAYKVERIMGRPLDWVSGGNSSSLPLLLAGRMPEGVNNLRIGEAILQGGRDTFLEQPWPALDRDAFLLSGELLEVKVKPSLPIGKSGRDAFGQRPNFTDEGDRLRGIANIGREDVIVEGLEPINAGVRVLGASSDHLVLDLTDAKPSLKVGDRLTFRITYGAMLAVMTSEYVEKVPVKEVSEHQTRKSVSFVVEPGCGNPFVGASLHPRLAAIGYEVLDDVDASTVRVDIGSDRRVALGAMRKSAQRHESLGLIWIDSRAAMMPNQDEDVLADGAVLTRIIRELPPQVSPECVVLVGLREAEPAEAAALKSSRMTVFTIVDIDARGMRDVMRQAIRIASAGTDGFHVSYSPTVTEIPGWADGAGGVTVRETHQAMEAIAEHGGMISLSLVSITPESGARVIKESSDFLMSALGKHIL
jgi:predicted amino acid racemase/arginase family enzyme